MPVKGETTLRFPDDHPALAGHFPGNPIIPGAMLLDEAIHAIESSTGLKINRINSAKFLSPAEPGEQLSIHFEILASGSICFDIREDSRDIATGSFGTMVSTSP